MNLIPCMADTCRKDSFCRLAIFACDVFSFVVFKLIRSIFKSPSGILVRVQQDFIENTLHLWRPCNITFKTHLVDLLLMVEINWCARSPRSVSANVNFFLQTVYVKPRDRKCVNYSSRLYFAAVVIQNAALTEGPHRVLRSRHPAYFFLLIPVSCPSLHRNPDRAEIF